MGALYEAVRGGDLAALKEQLKKKPFLEEQGDDGMTPLILAAKTGQPQMVRLLLEAGADATWHDKMHESAIMKAGAEGHHTVVALLTPKSAPDDVAQAKAFLATFKQTAAPM